MEIANYILSIFKINRNIVWSWGFHNPISLPENKGLVFKVEGFLHQGWVVVEYNEGADLFDIILLSEELTKVKIIEEVYIDELINTIDDNVECCNDYEEKVKDKYSLL